MGFDLDSYVWDTEDEAWELIGDINLVIEDEGHCTIAALKHILNVGTFNDDYNWGWTSTDSVKIVHDGQFGWHIYLDDPSMI